MEMHGERAKVWLSEVTTPYATTRSGADPQPTLPYAQSHVLLFERAGDSWRLSQDLTKAEFAD
ncbi:hypothetical protein QWM81_04640 [Streptomyces ficellus]|uniref:DUF4440 domain-containing protein n=1 Tax=Streptomyces ficellus TaxID=1977088 RepID=A0ABT7Z1H8_9ACTN|nr:hypothetical protein [Streptomyces ficellus]MDN3293347.1 hypothetical protein [Streptomyces ficellus]